ncbi:hypothetical protein GCM10023231_38170 [Olivibacter ginsenosidimutans]|uniref:Tetratricopeptide repeat protein n=1 Tax=Olivibacter ginsenosidimutans TaxID=1176537 RepID=A0ABP9C7Y0_9SPHI
MTDVNYENIERYLSGNMTAKERDNFEAELDENEELAQELHFYKYVNQSIFECLYQRTTDAIGTPYPHALKTKKQLKMNALKWISLIAVALLFGGVWLWSPWQSDKFSDIHTIKMDTKNTEGIPVDGKYADIIERFNEGKYEEALPLLNSALTEQPDDLYIRYYRGLTFLNLHYLGSARRDLLKIYTENDPKMYQAAYFIAVSYTEEEEDYKADALKWLQKIPKESTLYNKAQALEASLK